MGFYPSEDYPICAIVPSAGVTEQVPVVVGAALIVPVETKDYDSSNTDATFRGYLFGRLLGVAADSSVLAIGDAVYWDATNSCVTATADDNRMMGVAISAKASTATTADVRIYPVLVA